MINKYLLQLHKGNIKIITANYGFPYSVSPILSVFYIKSSIFPIILCFISSSYIDVVLLFSLETLLNTVK